MKFLAISALLLGAALADHVRFDGHKVYSFTPTTKRHVDGFQQLAADGVLIDYWRFPNGVGRPIEFVLSPKDAPKVLATLAAFDVTPAVIDDDVQKSIDASLDELRSATPYQGGDTRAFDIANYHSLDEYASFFNDLASANDFVDVIDLGKSFESRSMPLVKIGKAGNNKPGFWIDCGIHAREWLSPTTCAWMINYIISEYNKGTQTWVDLVNGVDFYILNNLNPDGYAYTRSTNRLWRKTRSGPYSGNCVGVDPNRNWDAKWSTTGASNNPCSETFYGPSVFSEVENQHARDFIVAHPNIKAYITIHTFSELWLLPYSFGPMDYPDDHDDLVAISTKVVDAIKGVHGQTYKQGTAADILYSVSGGSHDWAKLKQNIKWSFAMELRPKSALGAGGFIQPASQIVPTAEETLAGLKVIMDRVLADGN